MLTLRVRHLAPIERLLLSTELLTAAPTSSLESTVPIGRVLLALVCRVQAL